jgi:hypothetical protein
VGKLALVGRLWEDADFKMMKMDLYCKDMWEALEVDATDPRMMLRNFSGEERNEEVGSSGGHLAIKMVEEDVCQIQIK